MVRILFLVENFRQGWGGAPESVRLMARELARLNIASDVFERGVIHRDIQAIRYLPRDGSETTAFNGDLAGYGALLHVGPWQHLRFLLPLIRRRGEVPYYYLPRGGLARIEFEGRRNVKKLPYALLVERWFTSRADGVILSSQEEADALNWTYRSRAPRLVIPDYFHPAGVEVASARNDAARSSLTIGFLAEIGRRKGLLPFAGGLVAFALQHPQLSVRFRIGGAPRAGQHGYLAEVERSLADAPANLTVEWLGPVPHQDRTGFYRSLDLFAAPSLFESFGLTPLEALVEQTPVLCGPRLGVLEYLGNLPFLSVAEEASVDGFAAALNASWDGLAKTEVDPALVAAAIDGINRTADQRWTALPGLACSTGQTQMPPAIRTRDRSSSGAPVES